VSTEISKFDPNFNIVTFRFDLIESNHEMVTYEVTQTRRNRYFPTLLARVLWTELAAGMGKVEVAYYPDEWDDSLLSSNRIVTIQRILT
jgi:hypothetical protein